MVQVTFNMAQRGPDNNLVEALTVLAREGRYELDTTKKASLTMAIADSAVKTILPHVENDGSAYVSLDEPPMYKADSLLPLFGQLGPKPAPVYEAITIVRDAIIGRDIQAEIQQANSPADVLKAKLELEAILYSPAR